MIDTLVNNCGLKTFEQTIQKISNRINTIVLKLLFFPVWFIYNIIFLTVFCIAGLCATVYYYFYGTPIDK